MGVSLFGGVDALFSPSCCLVPSRLLDEKSSLGHMCFRNAKRGRLLLGQKPSGFACPTVPYEKLLRNCARRCNCFFFRTPTAGGSFPHAASLGTATAWMPQAARSQSFQMLPALSTSLLTSQRGSSKAKERVAWRGWREAAP